MGRPKQLPKTLQDHDFQLLAKKEQHVRTRFRLLGMAHLKEGWDYNKIATVLAAVVIRVKIVAKTPCFIIGALPQTPHSP